MADPRLIADEMVTAARDAYDACDDFEHERFRAAIAAALSASAPAREGVVVRVAVAIDEQGRGHTRQIGNSHASTEAEAWDDLLEWNEADRRSCIATIVAPIPTVPEIAASVEPAGEE